MQAFDKNTSSNLSDSSVPKEGKITRALERQTAKIPSAGFLALAIGSMVASLGIEMFSRRKEAGNFVGLWAPTLLLFGIYNKIVKTHGSDSASAA